MNGTAVAVRDGKDVVNGMTGEVVTTVAPFEMRDYLTSLDNRAIEQQRQLAAAYDQACTALIGPNDVQEDKGRTFKKKSAWRKLARYFSISTEVSKVDRSFEGDVFLATVTVRAYGPWGQSAEAVGACGTDEATGRRTITMADAVATAETRATNRAISNLIAMGEVSAEEMSKGSGGTSAPRGNKAPGDKVMPFGKTKGTKLADIDTADLESAVAWCRKTDAEKFSDLIENIGVVLADRAGGALPVVEDDFDPHSLEDSDSDLPF